MWAGVLAKYGASLKQREHPSHQLPSNLCRAAYNLAAVSAVAVLPLAAANSEVSAGRQSVMSLLANAWQQVSLAVGFSSLHLLSAVARALVHPMSTPARRRACSWQADSAWMCGAAERRFGAAAVLTQHRSLQPHHISLALLTNSILQQAWWRTWRGMGCSAHPAAISASKQRGTIRRISIALHYVQMYRQAEFGAGRSGTQDTGHAAHA